MKSGRRAIERVNAREFAGLIPELCQRCRPVIVTDLFADVMLTQLNDINGAPRGRSWQPHNSGIPALAPSSGLSAQWPPSTRQPWPARPAAAPAVSPIGLERDGPSEYPG
jgi:hypothetical protein